VKPGKAKGLEKWRGSRAGRTALRPKLNPHEQAVADELRADGWKVLRNGWPDFLATRGDEVRLIEVKSPGDSLRVEQKRLHRALRTLGIEVELVRPKIEGVEAPGPPDRRASSSES
jgi:hypothetical protein